MGLQNDLGAPLDATARRYRDPPEDVGRHRHRGHIVQAADGAGGGAHDADPRRAMRK